MYLSAEKKAEIFKENSLSHNAKDTGSSESQVALFTHRIKHLTEHLQTNKKDHSTRLGLLKMVGRRRRILDHLAQEDVNRYRQLILSLGIRK